MKFVLFLLLIHCNIVLSQHNGGVPTTNIGGMATNVNVSLSGGTDQFVYGKALLPTSSELTEGSPFLKPNFTNAYIKLKSGLVFVHSPIKFNILNNEIDFEKDKVLYNLLNIDSLSYSDSIYQNMILKTGYPAINKHDTGSLYQIIAQNDKIQLLKYYYCYVETEKTLGLPDKSVFRTENEYYLFNDSTKMIKEVKLNKKSFIKAMDDIGIPFEKNNQTRVSGEKDFINIIDSMFP